MTYTTTNLGAEEPSIEQKLFDSLSRKLIDPLARDLAKEVKWVLINDIHNGGNEKYPIAITGSGPPILLLHGFDSSFLEFRRLAPLLKDNYQLIIPDLFGFGFCPRPKGAEYGIKNIIKHLQKIIEIREITQGLGVVGASMGGAVAMELARNKPKEINRLLLLAPAGLTGKPMKIPPLLDRLGVCFLSLPAVRKGLCKQAFADPNKSVGIAEEQIASLHLQVPGWGRSLAEFAQKGGIANLGLPKPKQQLLAIFGQDDRILKGEIKTNTINLIKPFVKEVNNCGHLPHLDRPEVVAELWDKDTTNE